MKKRLLCLLSVIAIVAIIIPSGSALAWDSRTMNRISNEYANVYWIDKIDLEPRDGISDRFAVWNINVNKTDESTNIYINIDTYDFPYFDQTKEHQWGTPWRREWGQINTTADIFCLEGKKVLTGATLNSVTLLMNNSMGNPPRELTIQIDWTAFGTLYTSSERGQYTGRDITIKYSDKRENIQATPTGTLNFNPPPPLAPQPRPIPPYATGNIGTYERTETIVDK